MQRHRIERMLLEELKKIAERPNLRMCDVKEYGPRRGLLERAFDERFDELFHCPKLDLWAVIRKEHNDA